MWTACPLLSFQCPETALRRDMHSLNVIFLTFREIGGGMHACQRQLMQPIALLASNMIGIP